MFRCCVILKKSFPSAFNSCYKNNRVRELKCGTFIYIRMDIAGSELSINIQIGKAEFLKQISSEHAISINIHFPNTAHQVGTNGYCTHCNIKETY